MKIFNSLPTVIHRKGKTYKADMDFNHLDERNQNLLKASLRAKKQTFITVHVLAKNLRNRTDLHGNLYKPSTWLFVEQ